MERRRVGALLWSATGIATAACTLVRSYAGSLVTAIAVVRLVMVVLERKERKESGKQLVRDREAVKRPTACPHCRARRSAFRPVRAPLRHARDPAAVPAGQADKQHRRQHTERKQYEEKAKIAVVRALVPVAILIASPVLLIAGAPIRHRYLRYIYRDEAPLILEKKRGRVSVHWFVVTSPLLDWLCRPTESLARLVSRRGQRAR
ncbi:hypothetical protein [Streptomyces sp. YIM S03343]